MLIDLGLDQLREVSSVVFVSKNISSNPLWPMEQWLFSIRKCGGGMFVPVDWMRRVRSGEDDFVPATGYLAEA